MTADNAAVYTDGQGDHWRDTGTTTATGEPILLLLDGSDITYPHSEVEFTWPPLRRIATEESR